MTDPLKRQPEPAHGVESRADGHGPGSIAAYAHRWLHENGAALEMRVAGKFRVTPSEVEHSGYFRDVTTGVLREFDVHATFTKASYQPEINFKIHVVAECKATNSPWILFMASEVYGVMDWDFEGLVASSASDETSIRDLHGFPFAPAFRTSGQAHAYQVVAAEKKNNAPYLAVRQVLDAVEGIRSGHSAGQPGAGGPAHPRFGLFLPVVVTTSPLFEARLSATGDIDLAEIDLVPLFAKGDSRDDPAGVVTRLVWVVHESAVDKVVGKVLDSLNMMSLGGPQ